MSGSGTTLSSWDSAWEPGGLAASLPSCTAQNSGNDERRSSITDSGSPLSPGPCLTSDRLWAPPSSQPPGIFSKDTFSFQISKETSFINEKFSLVFFVLQTAILCFSF